MQADWCNPKHDFVAPFRSVGTVVSNGKVSQEMINHALSNHTPYYPLPDVASRGQLSSVKRGEIVVQSHDSRIAACASSCSTDLYVMERDNCTMKGLTVLNGQGDCALSNWDLANTMQVMGIVEMDNGCNNLYNIVSDGIHDVRNNGNETITVGDTVIAYFPTLEELPLGAGKNRNVDEKSGLVKAWYKPYKPGLHAFTVKGLYNCMLDTGKTKPYLPAYRRACHQIMDSVAGLAMVMIARILPDLREAFTGPQSNTTFASDAELLSYVLARVGHSKFTGANGADPMKRAEVVDSMFVPFSTNSRNATEYLFPNSDGASKREKGLMRQLNDVQQESMSTLLDSIRQFQAQLNNQIIGRAKSTAPPGGDFSLKVDK